MVLLVLIHSPRALGCPVSGRSGGLPCFRQSELGPFPILSPEDLVGGWVQHWMVNQGSGGLVFMLNLGDGLLGGLGQ